MVDVKQDAPSPDASGKMQIHPGSAAAGALGGTAISVTLFTTLNIKGIIENPHYGPNYALMIFSLVMVTIFLAGILTLPGRFGPDRRGIVIAGFALVGLIAVSAAAPFVVDSLIHPTLTVEGALQPDLSLFQDDDTISPIKLSATWDNQDGSPKAVGPSVEQITLNTGRPWTIKVANLPALFDKYRSNLRDLNDQKNGAADIRKSISELCIDRAQKTKPICILYGNTYQASK